MIVCWGELKFFYPIKIYYLNIYFDGVLFNGGRRRSQWKDQHR
jgi:hypothetical protein